MSGKQRDFSFRSAAIWSLVVAMTILLPVYTLATQDFWNSAPGTGGAGLIEGPNDTPEQKLDTVFRMLAIGVPINLAALTLALFVFLAPISVLAQIIRRHLPGRN